MMASLDSRKAPRVWLPKQWEQLVELQDEYKKEFDYTKSIPKLCLISTDLAYLNSEFNHKYIEKWGI